LMMRSVTQGKKINNLHHAETVGSLFLRGGISKEGAEKRRDVIYFKGGGGSAGLFLPEETCTDAERS